MLHHPRAQACLPIRASRSTAKPYLTSGRTRLRRHRMRGRRRPGASVAGPGRCLAFLMVASSINGLSRFGSRGVMLIVPASSLLLEANADSRVGDVMDGYAIYAPRGTFLDGRNLLLRPGSSLS